MTEQQHEAGRETDALVARVVMGLDTAVLQWCEQWGPDPNGGAHQEQCRRCGNMRILYGLERGGPCSPVVPAYSTDRAAAMLVFEAMVERTGTGSIYADMEDARGQGFICGVVFGFNGEGAMGPLPLAICRAALAAVEQQS